MTRFQASWPRHIVKLPFVSVKVVSGPTAVEQGTYLFGYATTMALSAGTEAIAQLPLVISLPFPAN
jgi:hypothetical protein